MSALLDADILDGRLLATFGAIAVVLAGVIIVLPTRRLRIRSVLFSGIALASGGLIGVLVQWLTVDVLNLFDGPIAPWARVWIVLTFAGTGLAGHRLFVFRRAAKILPLVSLLWFILAGTLAVNAVYGLNPTVGAFLGVSRAPTITLGPRSPDSIPSGSAVRVADTWTPPAGMPAAGTVSQIQGGIPNSVSRFPARTAQIYLPPAALVANAPQLPLIVMMMGQPGNPDASLIAGASDAFAHEHRGLAPIVLVVDQLGDPFQDSLCLDTARGKVETYIMKDVVPWARTHLNVVQDRRRWTIGGFSNGGTCAIYLGAKYPQTWGNVIDLSGEEFAGFGEKDTVLKEIFHGDQSAYDRVKPDNIMAASTYADTDAVFTIGQNDWHLATAKAGVVASAERAGMRTHFHALPGVGHTGPALTTGFPTALKDLARRLGLE